MDTVTIPRKEYERLKALENIDYVAHTEKSIVDAKNGRIERVS